MTIIPPCPTLGIVTCCGDDEQLPVTEVARILGCNVRTVHRMIQAGKLPGRRAHQGVRAPYLVMRSDVDALLSARGETAA